MKREYTLTTVPQNNTYYHTQGYALITVDNRCYISFTHRFFPIMEQLHYIVAGEYAFKFNIHNGLDIVDLRNWTEGTERDFMLNTKVLPKFRYAIIPIG